MQLSERQQRTAAVAITILSTAVILAALLGVFWMLASFVRAFSQVFLPVAVAGVAAFVFQPVYELLRVRLGLSMPFALLSMFLIVLLPVAVFAAFFGVIIVNQLAGVLEELPDFTSEEWWNGQMQSIGERWPNAIRFFNEHSLGQKIQEAIQGHAAQLVNGLVAAGSSVVNWTGGMLSWCVVPVYFVFFVIAERKNISHLEDYLPFLKEETRKDIVFLVQEFVTILVAFFRGQMIIAFLQGVLLAIGFSLVGLKYGLVFGFLLGFLNIIPYLGSMLGIGITLPLAYFQEGGGWLTVLGVVVVLVCVQIIEGYFLTPKIMGDRTGLHPMVIMVAIFFWGSALGGILGMILAIPLTAFLVVFWRLAKEKYIAEWV